MKNKLNLNYIVFVFTLGAISSLALFFFMPYKIAEGQSYSASVNIRNIPEDSFIGDRPLSYYGMTAGSALQGGTAVPIAGIANVPSGQYINGVYSDKPVYYNSDKGSNITLNNFQSGAVPPTGNNDNTGGGNSNGNSGVGSYGNTNYVGSTYSGGNYNNGVYANNNYGSASYGSGTYVGSSYSSSSYGSSSYGAGGSSSYSGNSYGSSSYTAQSYQGSSYGGSSYASNSYGGSSYGGNSYGQSSYGQSQVAGAAMAYQKCEPYLKSYVGYGKNNNADEVKKLQDFLNKHEGEKLLVSGVFDLPTLEAVKRFQDKYAKDILQDSWGLSCNTGYVYITTLAKINDIVCNTSTDFSKIPLPNPRPVYYCSGAIDPITKQAVPCTAVSTVSATTSPNSTLQSVPNVPNENTPTAGGQAAGVGFYPMSILSSAKSAWKNALTN